MLLQNLLFQSFSIIFIISIKSNLYKNYSFFLSSFILRLSLSLSLVSLSFPPQIIVLFPLCVGAGIKTENFNYVFISGRLLLSHCCLARCQINTKREKDYAGCIFQPGFGCCACMLKYLFLLNFCTFLQVLFKNNVK